MADLSVSLFGKTLRNPVMNASGTLGYGTEIEPLWPLDELGAYVSKGLSSQPHHGNPPPRLWEEKSGLINSVGLQNIGLKRFFDEVFPLFRERATPVVVNFFGFTEEEYARAAESIRDDPLIAALEMNLSCPNVAQGGICLGKRAEDVFRVVRKVKAATGIPLLAKLTPEVAEITAIARAAYEAGADGITVFNTMPAAAVDVEERRVALKGGLSGPFLKPMTLRAVADISGAIPVPGDRRRGRHGLDGRPRLPYGRRLCRPGGDRDIHRSLCNTEGHQGPRRLHDQSCHCGRGPDQGNSACSESSLMNLP